MAIGAGRDEVERHAPCIGQCGPFQALFAPIHGRSARLLAPPRRFRDAAIDHDVVKIEPNHPVILRQR
jgi:hypothetical protein